MRVQTYSDPSLRQNKLTILLEKELALRDQYIWHTDGDGSCCIAAVIAAARSKGIPTPGISTVGEARHAAADAYVWLRLAYGVQEGDMKDTLEYMKDLYAVRSKKERVSMVKGAGQLDLPPLWNTTTGEVERGNVRECIKGLGGSSEECAKATALLRYVYGRLADSSIMFGENLMDACAHVVKARIATVAMGMEDDGEYLFANGVFGTHLAPDAPLLVIAHMCLSNLSNEIVGPNHYGAIVEETSTAASAHIHAAHPGAAPRVVPWLLQDMWKGPDQLDSLLLPRSAPGAAGVRGGGECGGASTSRLQSLGSGGGGGEGGGSSLGMVAAPTHSK